MPKPLRILIVEDSEDDLLFVLRELQRGGYEPIHERVETEATFNAALTGQEWDIVIADYSLPQFNALEALRLLQRSGLDLPFIIVSGAIGEEVAVAAMRSGAHDYILKNSLARLVPAVERELRDAQVRKERRNAEEENQRLAAIVESSGDAIIGKKLDGTITNWNPGAERLFGYTEEQVKGHSMLMLLPSDRLDEESRILEKLKRGQSIESFETVRVRKDGRWIDVSITVSPIKNSEGRIIGVSKIARDITERKRAETCVAALSKLGQNLSSASTPREAAYIIGNIADDLFGWDAFVLDLYSADDDSVRTVLNADIVDGQRREVPPVNAGKKPSAMARRVIEHGAELILRPDGVIAEADAVPFGDALRPSASLMYVPIRNQARVIGILSVQSYADKAYEKRDLNTLQTLADYCGGALERIRVREELRESEERFRKLSDSAPVGIFENDIQGHCTYVNPRWTAISGLSFEKSLGGGWAQVIHPEDREKVEQGWAQAVAEGREWNAEYRLLTPQGAVRWIRVQAASVLSQEGRHAAYVGTVEDITQSKKAADALRAAQERLQHLVSSSPSVLYSLKANGGALLPSWVSENIAQMTGYGPEETLTSRWWAERLHLDRGINLLTEGAARNRLVEEYPLLRKDGTELWIRDEKKLLRNATGELVEVVGSWSDITDRKLGEEARRRLEAEREALLQRLQSILDHMPIGCILSDTQHRFTYWNPAAEEIFGYHFAEVRGKHPVNLITSADSQPMIDDILRRVAEGNLVADGVSENITKDGRTIICEWKNTPLRQADGNFSGIISMCQDVTKRKLAEEELRQSREQLRALAAHLQSVREEERKRITREIHDELGQSLTGFKMDLAWMRNRLVSEEGAVIRQPLVEKIGAMGTLLDGTASLMRKLCTELRPGVLDDLGLTAAIEWQAREYQLRTGIQCDVRLELGDLDVDPERSTALFRIFQEILTNVARHARATRVDAVMRQSEQHLFLEVSDNGRGIKESEKAASKSLGLLGMRERAFILGGEVSIQGKSGKGTVVRVKMPVSQDAVREEGNTRNGYGAVQHNLTGA